MRWLTLLAAVAVLALAGCGGDDEERTASERPRRRPRPRPRRGRRRREPRRSRPTRARLKFDKTELTAKAGKVTITMDNPSDIPHAVEIEGNGVERRARPSARARSRSPPPTSRPGTYDFYCPVGNHRAAGMEGKLTVS